MLVRGHELERATKPNVPNASHWNPVTPSPAAPIYLARDHWGIARFENQALVRACSDLMQSGGGTADCLWAMGYAPSEAAAPAPDLPTHAAAAPAPMCAADQLLWAMGYAPSEAAAPAAAPPRRRVDLHELTRTVEYVERLMGALREKLARCSLPAACGVCVCVCVCV